MEPPLSLSRRYPINQKPERRRPFGTGLVRHCPQGLFSPFFTFLRAIYFSARLDFFSSPLSAPGSPRMKVARNWESKHWYACGADGRSGGRSVYGHVIIKFSRMGSLPDFLTHGASRRATRARAPLSTLVAVLISFHFIKIQWASSVLPNQCIIFSLL